MAISARLLKAIYFSDLDFLDAKLGSHPSQNWQAVLEGWDPLKVDLIRSIGDGKTTNGSSENWLPRDEGLLPVAPRKQGAPRKVCEYIDHMTPTWNVGKLEEFFLRRDVKVIRGIQCICEFVDPSQFVTSKQSK
jgi:hypothetical protein